MPKVLQNRPSRANSLDEVNIEIEKIYDLLNKLSLAVNVFSDIKNQGGESGNLRVSRNRTGNIVLEIRADDDWYTSSEIFKLTKAGE